MKKPRAHARAAALAACCLLAAAAALGCLATARLEMAAPKMARMATTMTMTTREATYVRPEPGADLPLESLLAEDDEAATQVSVRIAAEGRDRDDDKWTLEILYATSSLAAPRETSCTCTRTEGDEAGTSVSGRGRASTYSNLVSHDASYNAREGIYTSPYLHRCAVTVDADAAYSCAAGGRPEAVKIMTPPSAGKFPRAGSGLSGTRPFTFAVIADGGQTQYSNATYHGALAWLRAQRSSTLLYPGDLAYSDGDQRRWDSFGVLAEPLLSSVATVWGPGNHELSAQEAFVGYLERYGSAARELWFSERRGPVHFLSLCSYCRTEPGSAQYRWLERELERATLARNETPWVVVQFHAPWYCSNPAHHNEAKPMRTGMEPLFVKHHVDLVLSGHVHAYERMHPMQYDEATPCAPTYVVVGDGGNREKASPFLRIGSLVPSWSAFRQSSFGFASMEIFDDVRANWTWHRNPHDFDHFPGQPITPIGSFAHEDSYILDRTGCRRDDGAA